MKIRRVLIGNEGFVEVACPQCDRSLTLAVERIQEPGISVQARCGCGMRFSVVFERRAHYRKPTGLLGRAARKAGPELLVLDVIISDLSRGGLSLKFSRDPGLAVGELIRVDFRLDDGDQTLIRAQVVVKSIRRFTVGTEFHFLEEKMRKVLGFYLAP
ncbi:MAG: PilZ domain-containing protein [Syntrophobacteraceae bacterium]|jgi:hypothetical protein|nr:PilZ domain-containing protein [Syntrophobacteraceae bacterium]